MLRQCIFVQVTSKYYLVLDMRKGELGSCLGYKRTKRRLRSGFLLGMVDY